MKTEKIILIPRADLLQILLIIFFLSLRVVLFVRHGAQRGVQQL
jgi:hypothetical protein